MLGALIGGVLVLLSGALLVPAGVVLLEALLAALIPRRRVEVATGPKPRFTILIPARNEEGVIGGTIRMLCDDHAPSDCILVVADNCDDATAEEARAAGARVVERRDPLHRGKGYALDFGLHALSESPPEVVVILDSDCVPERGSIDALVRHAAAHFSPVQAAYMIRPPASPNPLDEVSALAILLKSIVRPLGLAKLGLPCLLTGSGMAFPWEIIRAARLATGNIVEDMQLGLDLAIEGHYPRFLEQAWVWSELPRSRSAARTQRRRWEHGHLATLLSGVPRLLMAALRKRRPLLLALALELAVPPLSLLILLILGLGAACLGYGSATGEFTALALSASSLALIAASVAITWVRFGRQLVRARSLAFAPLYAISKIGLYLGFARAREQRWQRTPRD